MKRSKANDILTRRHEIDREFESIVTDEDMPEFRLGGCEICNNGGMDVYTCKVLKRIDILAGEFDATYTLELCPDCLCALVNGDDSDLNYYVTEEDI
jgi:hypothetical protein